MVSLSNTSNINCVKKLYKVIQTSKIRNVCNNNQILHKLCKLSKNLHICDNNASHHTKTTVYSTFL